MAGDEQDGLHRKRVFVGGNRLLAATLPAEVGGDRLARANARLAQSLRVGQQLVDALREPLDVARWTSMKPSPAAAISSGPGSPRQPIAGTPPAIASM